MKRLRFEYSMEITYSEPVERCYYTIKCIPIDSARQKINQYQIEMIPESKPEWAFDSHGNKYIFGCNEVPHKTFRFCITGDAICGMENHESNATENEIMIYRHGTGMTLAGEQLKAYYEKLDAELHLSALHAPLEKAKLLMHSLHEDFLYEKDSTTVDTTAEAAFETGKGVCQDYAHILISLLHMAGCSARYVTGLLIGEGESHAWVEVEDQGKWYGIDPTNDVVVTDSHIKIGVGRDATECQINRGVMHGGGRQGMDIRVSVTDVGLYYKFI